MAEKQPGSSSEQINIKSIKIKGLRDLIAQEENQKNPNEEKLTSFETLLRTAESADNDFDWNSFEEQVIGVMDMSPESSKDNLRSVAQAAREYTQASKSKVDNEALRTEHAIALEETLQSIEQRKGELKLPKHIFTVIEDIKQARSDLNTWREQWNAAKGIQTPEGIDGYNPTKDLKEDLINQGDYIRRKIGELQNAIDTEKEKFYGDDEELSLLTGIEGALKVDMGVLNRAIASNKETMQEALGAQRKADGIGMEKEVTFSSVRGQEEGHDSVEPDAETVISSEQMAFRGQVEALTATVGRLLEAPRLSGDLPEQLTAELMVTDRQLEQFKNHLGRLSAELASGALSTDRLQEVQKAITGIEQDLANPTEIFVVSAEPAEKAEDLRGSEETGGEIESPAVEVESGEDEEGPLRLGQDLRVGPEPEGEDSLFDDVLDGDTTDNEGPVGNMSTDDGIEDAEDPVDWVIDYIPDTVRDALQDQMGPDGEAPVSVRHSSIVEPDPVDAAPTPSPVEPEMPPAMVRPRRVEPGVPQPMPLGFDDGEMPEVSLEPVPMEPEMPEVPERPRFGVVGRLLDSIFGRGESAVEFDMDDLQTGDDDTEQDPPVETAPEPAEFVSVEPMPIESGQLDQIKDLHAQFKTAWEQTRRLRNSPLARTVDMMMEHVINQPTVNPEVNPQQVTDLKEAIQAFQQRPKWSRGKIDEVATDILQWTLDLEDQINAPTDQS